MSKVNGFIFYRGPSMLDGKPIVAIATGISRTTRNGKTGGEVQTWILNADMSPLDAANNGATSSICGDCKHQGAVVDGKNIGRSCYVTLFQAPLVVFKAQARGLYPTVAPQEAAELLAGLMLRLGSYGDPAAVPVAVWQAMLTRTVGHTGYSHQWADERFQGLRDYCMASCDSEGERTIAKNIFGWRTFRVMSPGDLKSAGEVTCPASKEAGAKTSCALCKACGGTNAKARADISIVAHGMASKVTAFNARAAA